MKKTQKLLILIFSTLFLSSCDTNDNTFYNDVFATVPNLVQVDVPVLSFQINDRLYVNCTVDRLLNEANQTNPLDIRETTGNAASLNFSYTLEKKINATEWQAIDFTANSNVDIVYGGYESGSFILAKATYNTSLEKYQYRVGLPLQTAGQYRLSFGYNSSSTDAIELRSESLNNNVFLNIFSTESNSILDTEGYFYFNVL
jgi:hypothetical protein